MSDVLVIVAPIEGAYPSQNHTGRDGFRGGRKSQEYRALFAAIESAALEEMARVDWACAEYACAVDATLYHRTGRAPDASNVAKCELDALTSAGVWVDDRLANPVRLATEYDPAGKSRIVLVVRRRFPAYVPPTSSLLREARKARAKGGPHVTVPIEVPGLEYATLRPARTAWVDGKPVPLAQALEEIRKGKMR